MSDPAELPGLAHFCEHMLFLGTEKVRTHLYMYAHVSVVIIIIIIIHTCNTCFIEPPQRGFFRNNNYKITIYIL